MDKLTCIECELELGKDNGPPYKEDTDGHICIDCYCIRTGITLYEAYNQVYQLNSICE